MFLEDSIRRNTFHFSALRAAAQAEGATKGMKTCLARKLIALGSKAFLLDKIYSYFTNCESAVAFEPSHINEPKIIMEMQNGTSQLFLV